jgi:hypothetical protein
MREPQPPVPRKGGRNMIATKHSVAVVAAGALLAIFFVIGSGCLSAGSKAQQNRSETQDTAAARQSVWTGLLQRNPYPYVIPLPEAKPTVVDGTYTKVVVTQSEHVHCRRCPDYAPEGGLWKLNLDRGVFRIFHAATGWRSIGTFILAGDRLLLANDPTCQECVGVYTWKLEEGKLRLQTIDDPCAIKLRAMNFTQQPWLSCRPPSTEAAVSGHWPQPAGCE